MWQPVRTAPFEMDIELAVIDRAVQFSILSLLCNRLQRFDMQRGLLDSLTQRYLNLCEATESFGGRLEVIPTLPLAPRVNPRPAAR